MKKNFLIIIVSMFYLNIFGQSSNTLNYKSIETSEKLKSIHTYLYKSVDTTKSEGRLHYKILFDNEGKKLEEYVYTFWDIVSYDHTTTYTYDIQGNLIEETIMQNILNLGPRDAEFIKVLGKDPINEKIFYYYDNLNRLITKKSYTFRTKELDLDNETYNTVTYLYNDKGALIEEIGSALNKNSLPSNYEKKYTYDNKGNKIKEYYVQTAIPKSPGRITTFIYNEQNQLIEEVVVDNEISWNNKHLKYEYNNNNKLSNISKKIPNSNKWEIIETFTYDERGNSLRFNEDTIFEYYENGFIKQEMNKIEGDEFIWNFITFYEFY